MEVLMIAALGLMLAALQLRDSTPSSTPASTGRIVRHPPRSAELNHDLKRRRIVAREAATHERRLAWLDVRRSAESDPRLAARWEALLALELDRHARSLERLA